MASNAPSLPPYVRLATVQGVVVMQRTTSSLWTGRGLMKLDYAKKGFLSGEEEKIEWSEARNCCMVYMKPSTLTVQWEGPGREKPMQTPGAKAEFKGMLHKPVKVLGAYICGLCRITLLPRLTIVTQWDLRGERWILKNVPASGTEREMAQGWQPSEKLWD
ncbi:hypothetical protein PAMP_001367 [Pampus punctatissimus]